MTCEPRQPDFTRLLDGISEEEVRAGMPLLREIVRSMEEHAATLDAASASGSGDGRPSASHTHDPGGPTHGIQGNPSLSVEPSAQKTARVHFDFAKKTIRDDRDEERFRNNQVWKLIESGVRQGCVSLLDGFLRFDEWRSQSDTFEPKRPFQVVRSKANAELKKYGLGLERDKRETMSYALTGWDDARHSSNVGQATIKLQETLTAVRNRRIRWDTALDRAIQIFELDPESLPAAFLIIACLQRLPNATATTRVMKRINQLLRRQEYVYAGAIAAIERCEALVEADIGRRLARYHVILERIRRRRRIMRTVSQFHAACGDEDARTDQIINHIQAIQQNTGQGDPAAQCEHLEKLLDTSPMRTVKSEVIARVTRACPRGWADLDVLDAEFDTCFTELIMNKVDCAKLRHPDSLASYVKKSIPAMLLDRANDDVYGLSYSKFAYVRKMQKAEHNLRQQFGHAPSDEEVARTLQISVTRLYRIKEWKRCMSQCRSDDRRDDNPENDESFQPY